MTSPYTPANNSPYKRKKHANVSDRRQLAYEQGDVYGRERDQGDAATDEYLGQALDFDASEGLNDYARGAYATISDQLGEELKRLRGSAVGAGRLDTGFYDEDRGELVRSTQRDFSNALAQQALNAQGQQLRNAEGLASFGQGQQRDANDLLTSRREELENAYREEQERKRKGGLGGFLGGVVGSVVPGIGSAIGGALGSKIGGLF